MITVHTIKDSDGWREIAGAGSVSAVVHNLGPHRAKVSMETGEAPPWFCVPPGGVWERQSAGAVYASNESPDPLTLSVTETDDIDVILSRVPASLRNPVANPSGMGPRPVEPTPAGGAARFAAPDGDGDCTEDNPGSVYDAVSGATAGDVVFLRGGTYRLHRHLMFAADGEPDRPITVESYPGELAVFDGSHLPYRADVRLRVTGSHYAIRRIEIVNMPYGAGLSIAGSHNLVEGVYSHHNTSGPGIRVNNNGSYNVMRSCTVADNSGVGIFDEWCANGAHSDGIGISSGDGNRIVHCAAYRNSDDGVDTWQGTNTYVGYSIAAQNGLGDGDGKGFKAGGIAPSNNTLVEHSIAYQNTVDGFDANTGVDVRFLFNTAWNNGRAGFWAYPSTDTWGNVSSDDGKPTNGAGDYRQNSWQREGATDFVSTSPDSPGFLLPKDANADIGAYSRLGGIPITHNPRFIAGDIQEA